MSDFITFQCRLVGVGCAIVRNAGWPESVRYWKRFGESWSKYRRLLVPKYVEISSLDEYCFNVYLNWIFFNFAVILDRPIRIPRSLSVKASNVLKGFLNKNPVERLGCNPELGFGEIYEHQFFKQIDWESVNERNILIVRILGWWILTLICLLFRI